MVPLENKRILVLGLGVSGLAAAGLLCRRGAKVVSLLREQHRVSRLTPFTFVVKT